MKNNIAIIDYRSFVKYSLYTALRSRMSAKLHFSPLVLFYWNSGWLKGLFNFPHAWNSTIILIIGLSNLRQNWTDIQKKVSRTDYFLIFFSFVIFLYWFFSKSVESFISNKISHKKFESDKNYKFSLGESYYQKQPKTT